MEKKPTRLSSSVLVLIFVLCCICFASTSLFPKSARPTPTAGAEVTSEPSATPAPTLPSALVPGIMPADVTLNLEKQFAMECGDVQKGAGYYSYYCNRSNSVASITAIVYGKKITSVDFITAAVLQFTTPDPVLPSDILGFIATIPFVDNSDLQDQAREWVKAGMPKITGTYQEFETDINGIHLLLSGTSTATTLEIGELQ